MLKLVAILGNVFALAFILFLIVTDGPPRDAEEYSIVAAFVIGPSINLLYIFRSRTGNPDHDSLWHLFVEAQKSKLRKEIAGDTKSGGQK